MKDFFISYNKLDKEWAEWIAWVLEEAGYSVVIQAWDFRPGANFILEMHRATEQTCRTLAVLSENYLNAIYTYPEWAATFVHDPQGQGRRLIPVRVQDCQPRGLLSALVYVDLVGLVEPEARSALLGALSLRGKPAHPPAFPHSGRPVSQSVVHFPGLAASSVSSGAVRNEYIPPSLEFATTQDPLTPDQKCRLQQELANLQDLWQLTSTKLAALRRALAIESGAAVKFQLEHQISTEAEELAGLSAKIEKLEQLIGACA